MAPDRPPRMGVEILDEVECRRLLAATSIGRIGLTVDALPVILPLRFGILEGDVIVRGGDGRELKAATAQQVMCFEIDGVDDETGDSWTVLVVGRAEIVTDARELEQARDLGLETWASWADDLYVRIPGDLISGRRVGHLARPTAVGKPVSVTNEEATA